LASGAGKRAVLHEHFGLRIYPTGPRARLVAIKYCEFEPTQHRNKRVALMVFLDEPGDPHPLAICDVCAKKLKTMRPDAIVMDRKDFEKQKKSKAAPAKPADEPDAQSSASSE
jgi:hypothetical protein